MLIIVFLISYNYFFNNPLNYVDQLIIRHSIVFLTLWLLEEVYNLEDFVFYQDSKYPMLLQP